MHKYTITSFKTFRGHDGDGFEATLRLDGKKIAVVVDDGWGGGYQYHWESLGGCARKRRNEKDGPDVRKIEEDRLLQATIEWYKTQSDDFDGDLSACCMDVFVGDLVDDFASAKDRRDWLMKVSRKKILIQFKGDEPDTYRHVSRGAPVSDKAATAREEQRCVQSIKKQYGDKVQCIVGLRSMDNIGTWISEPVKKVSPYNEANDWCKCEEDDNRGPGHFFDDGEHEHVHKHHWRCADCAKMTQIG